MTDTTTITYTMFVEEAESGASFGAWSVDLGVYATGDSREHAISEVRDAIEFHVAGLREDGIAVPTPAAGAERVTVTA
jgi:predicted RNase H-like HicB family nuclease